MICSACNHDNVSDDKFCSECGARLSAVCFECGAELKSKAKFCSECGSRVPQSDTKDKTSSRSIADYTPKYLADKILNTRSALEGERKRVTVLFADIKQSTELAASVDVEDWHKILDRFFSLLADGIHRYEGTVNQYTGDGVMALFGAPVTHEDDAQRACWSALALLDDVRAYARELKRWHGVDFQIRIGINSGEVVVGKIGDDLRMDYTAQGAVVHIAARAQDSAEAGTACLAPDTAELVAPYFELENLGEFRLKGVDAPICLYQLGGAGSVSSRFDVARSRGLTSFVGRTHEMQILDAALEQARAGNGQVVGIVAEPGTGKSRVCFEFLQALRNRGLKVLYGACVAHGRNLPFHPILQVLRNYYGITDQDDPVHAREKIASRMFAVDESYRDVLPLIYEFLGVPDLDIPPLQMAPEAKQRRLFGVLREGLRRGVEPGQEVSIVVIEDLHWIDEGSNEWVAQWVDSTAGAQSLLVVNFRPEYHAYWAHRTHYQQVSLAPFTLEATREMLTSMLGNDPSTMGLVDRIHAETGGNPFYAEEVVRTLIESGQLVGDRSTYVLDREIDRIEIPASVQAVLAARIDRLADREKQVLQAASVIGKDFAEPVLRAVLGISDAGLHEALNLLRAAEFVNEQTLFPVAIYSFKHPLTQQVANESLLRERRWKLHRLVAEALEAQSEELDEDAALLAHHYVAADEPVVGAHWHLRAADWIGVSDVNAAALHARAVINALEHREDTEGAYRFLSVAALKLLGMCVRVGVLLDVDDIYRRGRIWARKAVDPMSEAMICGTYALNLSVDNRMEESVQAYYQFQALAEDVGDPELILLSKALPGFSLIRMGRFDEAEVGVQEALGKIDRYPDLGLKFYGTGMIGIFSMWQTDIYAQRCHWSQMQQSFDRTLEWVVEHNEVECNIYLSIPLSNRVRLAGGAREHLPTLRDFLKLAEDFGAVWPLTIARLGLAWALLADGDSAHDVLEIAQAALIDVRDRRMALHYEGEVLAAMASAQLALGNSDEALELIREGIIKATPATLSLLSTLDSFVNITIALERLDECAEALDQMESSARDCGASNYFPLIVWRRADLAAARGDVKQQVRLLREAHAGFVERGATPHAETVGSILRANTEREVN